MLERARAGELLTGGEIIVTNTLTTNPSLPQCAKSGRLRRPSAGAS
jgi:hypothetical protein